MKEQNFNDQTKFMPIIQGSEVIQLKIDGETLDLKEKISLKEFAEELLPLLQKLEKYITLEHISVSEDQKSNINRSWDEETLGYFIDDLTYIQQAILWLVLQKKKIKRINLIEELNKNVQDNISIKKFAAEVAGMTRKWNQENFEPLITIKGNEYRFNQKYIELIIEAIKPVAYTELESTIDSILEKYDLNFGHKRIADNDGWMKFVFNYEKIVKDYDDAMLSFSILDRNYVDNHEPKINCNQNLIKVKKSLLDGLENHDYTINESKIINIEEEEREIIYLKATKEFTFVIYLG